jgi:Uma2 family endonuclease
VSDTPKITPATMADLLAIPEGERNHEVIDGVLLAKEAASGRHGGAQFELCARLGPYNRSADRPPGGWWLATEVEVLFEDTQVFKPDVVGWRRDRLAELPAVVPTSVLPDWLCEILSPSNRRRDLVQKKPVYHRHRVPHYWIVDPAAETLSVNRWHPDGYVEVLIAERVERVRAEPFDGVDLQVGVLFGDDPDK